MMFEPSARQRHAALGVGQIMFMWAGESNAPPSINASVMERFNVTSTSWEQPPQLLNRALPYSYYAMAVASDGENSYLFGGFAEQLVDDSPYTLRPQMTEMRLYHVNTMSLECCELVPATSFSPTARSLSALVCVNQNLLSYGGQTSGGVASNELFVFDLNTSKTVTLTVACRHNVIIAMHHDGILI